MHSGVASGTKRNQVVLRVVAGVAAKFLVVNLKVGHCAARLAPPAIAIEHLIANPFAELGEPQSFRMDSVHEAFSDTWCKNLCLSSLGRNLKNRRADCKRTPEFSFSKFAPRQEICADHLQAITPRFITA